MALIFFFFFSSVFAYLSQRYLCLVHGSCLIISFFVLLRWQTFLRGYVISSQHQWCDTCITRGETDHCTDRKRERERERGNWNKSKCRTNITLFRCFASFSHHSCHSLPHLSLSFSLSSLIIFFSYTTWWCVCICLSREGKKSTCMRKPDTAWEWFPGMSWPVTNRTRRERCKEITRSLHPFLLFFFPPVTSQPEDEVRRERKTGFDSIQEMRFFSHTNFSSEIKCPVPESDFFVFTPPERDVWSMSGYESCFSFYMTWITGAATGGYLLYSHSAFISLSLYPWISNFWFQLHQLNDMIAINPLPLLLLLLHPISFCSPACLTSSFFF